MADSPKNSIDLSISLGINQKLPITAHFKRILFRVGERHCTTDGITIRIGGVYYNITSSAAQDLVMLAKGRTKREYIFLTVAPVHKYDHDDVMLDIVYGAEVMTVHINSLPFPLSIPTVEFQEEAEKLLNFFNENASVPSAYSAP